MLFLHQYMSYRFDCNNSEEKVSLENYQKFYELDSSDSESSDEEDDDKEKDDNTAPKASKNKKSKSKSSGAKIDSKVPVANIDYARGEVFMSDSSSEEEDSSGNCFVISRKVCFIYIYTYLLI